jgi:hypothetical protein
VVERRLKEAYTVELALLFLCCEVEAILRLDVDVCDLATIVGALAQTCKSTLLVSDKRDSVSGSVG